MEPGTDDDRMKGALWTLNMNAFGDFLGRHWWWAWLTQGFLCSQIRYSRSVIRPFWWRPNAKEYNRAYSGCRSCPKDFWMSIQWEGLLISHNSWHCQWRSFSQVFNTRLCLGCLWKWYVSICPSITICIIVFEAINSFVEPCYFVFDIEHPPLKRQVEAFKTVLLGRKDQDLVVSKCKEERIQRIHLHNKGVRQTVRFRSISNQCRF